MKRRVTFDSLFSRSSRLIALEGIDLCGNVIPVNFEGNIDFRPCLSIETTSTLTVLQTIKSTKACFIYFRHKSNWRTRMMIRIIHVKTLAVAAENCKRLFFTVVCSGVAGRSRRRDTWASGWSSAPVGKREVRCWCKGASSEPEGWLLFRCRISLVGLGVSARSVPWISSETFVSLLKESWWMAAAFSWLPSMYHTKEKIERVRFGTTTHMRVKRNNQ